MQRFIFTFMLTFVLIGLTACPSFNQIATLEETAAQPATVFTTVSSERAMQVADVQVQVGVGSPLPVDIFVSGAWPDLCAQLSEIRQRIDGFTIAVTILTTAADPNCPPDYLGVPFRIAIPLNIVQLPAGEYTVTVNDVSTTFTWPVPAAVLRYEGPAEMGSSDPVKCASLELGAADQAHLVACDGATQTKQLGPQDASLWQEIQARFAPFVYETSTERLVFNGTGTVAGEAWQRALLAWARLKHAELKTGRVSASVATAMSWHLGQQGAQRNHCNQLTVLTFGYAYARTIACEGGDIIAQAGDWLTPAEIEQFDRWLYQRAAFNQENNYIAGQGTTPLSAAERVAVQEWAMTVYARLAPPVPPTPTPTRRLPPTPTRTPTPASIEVLPTDVQYVMAQNDIPIYAGPGAAHPVVGQVAGGMIAKVTGRSTDGQWWRVVCPDGTGNCWVSADPALTQPTTSP